MNTTSDRDDRRAAEPRAKPSPSGVPGSPSALGRDTGGGFPATPHPPFGRVIEKLVSGVETK